jgi:hypothetical protein
MQVRLNGFPTPEKETALVAGDLFYMRGGSGLWLCLAIEDGEGEADGYVALDGPPERGAVFPMFLNTGAVRGDVSRPPPFELTVEPLEDQMPQASAEYENGDLVIDSDGGPWIAVVEHARSKTFVNLRTGRPGAPKAPRLFFNGWRLCLRDGRRRIELASFGA